MPELLDAPEWVDKDMHIIEPLFYYCFLEAFPMRCVHDHFYTVDGPVTDESRIKRDIFYEINEYLDTGVARKANHLFNALKMAAYSEPMPLQTDRIHVANGTYHMDGTFTEDKEFCMNRLAVGYVPDAPTPTRGCNSCQSFFMRRTSPRCRSTWATACCPPPRGRRCLCSPARVARAALDWG